MRIDMWDFINKEVNVWHITQAKKNPTTDNNSRGVRAYKLILSIHLLTREYGQVQRYPFKEAICWIA
jgi:hypothetical protein